METIYPNECALWAACQHIAKYHNTCPRDIVGEDCFGVECGMYVTCWVLYFQKLVS